MIKWKLKQSEIITWFYKTPLQIWWILFSNAIILKNQRRVEHWIRHWTLKANEHRPFLTFWIKVRSDLMLNTIAVYLCTFFSFPNALCPRDKACLKQLRVRTSITLYLLTPLSTGSTSYLSAILYPSWHHRLLLWSQIHIKIFKKETKLYHFYYIKVRFQKRKNLSKNIKNIFAAIHNEILSDSGWRKENFTEISQMSLFIILNLTYLWGRNRMKFSVEFILNYLIWNG